MLLNHLHFNFRLLKFTIAMSDVDRYGRDRSRRRRCSSNSSSSTSRSRSRSRQGHGRSTYRHDRSRSRRHRSSFSHEEKHHRDRPDKDVQFEGESASGSDRDARDDSDDRSSRAKRLRRVNVDDSLSAFAPKTKTKLGHIPASEFAKSQWNSIRGMDPVSGKFVVKDRPKHDDWMKMAKSDRLINKWSGDPAFADTRLDDGLSSVIPKATSKEETDLVKTQRAIGALGHMVLSASEGYSKLYNKMTDFVLKNIGPATTPNPEFDHTVENDGLIPEFIFADHQNKAYAEFQNIQREWQVDVSEHLANAARTAAAWHIKMMAIRREKVITKIAKVNQKVANAVGKIPPSAHGMFGGDASELEKVVKLSKDLAGRHYNQPFQSSFASSATHKRGDGNPRGGGFTPRGSRGGSFQHKKDRGAKNFKRGR